MTDRRDALWLSILALMIASALLGWVVRFGSNEPSAPLSLEPQSIVIAWPTATMTPYQDPPTPVETWTAVVVIVTVTPTAPIAFPYCDDAALGEVCQKVPIASTVVMSPTAISCQDKAEQRYTQLCRKTDESGTNGRDVTD